MFKFPSELLTKSGIFARVLDKQAITSCSTRLKGGETFLEWPVNDLHGDRIGKRKREFRKNR